MRHEWLAFVLLCRAVGIDIIDMREIGLEFLLSQSDSVFYLEQFLPPMLQVRWIWYSLHITEMPLGCSSALHRNWSQVDLILQSAQSLVVDLRLIR